MVSQLAQYAGRKSYGDALGELFPNDYVFGNITSGPCLLCHSGRHLS